MAPCVTSKVNLENFHYIKEKFIGILLSGLSQNGLTKLVVWIFGGLSTVPPLRSSLLYRQAELDRRSAKGLLISKRNFTFFNCPKERT